MKTNFKKASAIILALTLLFSTLLSVNVFAADFTPSTLTVPSTVTLTTIKNFDEGLQNFQGGNAGTTGEGSVVVSETTLGYGESGASVKWTYDKSKADWDSPSFLDGSQEFYTKTGDGLFMWIKTEAAGTVRMEALADDWATTVHCDAEVVAGENLVYFPWNKFVDGQEGAVTFNSLGYSLKLYALTLPNTGTLYVDQFSTYVGSALSFTPSTLTVPSTVTLTTIKNFDEGLQNFKGGNAGTAEDGSVVVSETTLGYGESGASAKWTYDKSKADWNSPSFLDGSQEFYTKTGDGLFMWIKAEAAGTVRMEALADDWATTVHCDAEVVAGENLVYFPWNKFVDGQDGAVTFNSLGYGLKLYALTLPNTGTLYVDQFSTYVEIATSFTPSEKVVPSEIELTTIKNFDEGLQNFKGGNAGTAEDGSVVVSETTLGYGESGASVKWTYDKSKADWNSPSFLDGSQEFYTKTGDGLFMWIKTEAAGTVRMEALADDWATTVHCDAEVVAGENLVYFPWNKFVDGQEGAVTFNSLGYSLKLYALTLPNTGTLYVDQFSTYEDTTPDPEPDFFTPSTLRMPSNTGYKFIKDFDAGLQGFAAGNAGDSGRGSVVIHSAAYGYGTKGASAKFTWDKSLSEHACFRDEGEDFYDAEGEGFFMWIKAETAGTVRIQGLTEDWATSVYCDADVVEGENIVYFPYADFKKGAGDPATFEKVGYHLVVYPVGMPQKGSMYIDAFGVYGADIVMPEGGIVDEHSTENHKIIDNFDEYTDNNKLIEVWKQINSGDTGEGCQMTINTDPANAVSGKSLQIKYNSGKATWTSPGAQRLKPDNQDFQGDGFCFWFKTEKESSMRVAWLTEDCEVVYDLKNIPAGFEGYIHIPYSEMRYFQAGIEVPYEEIGFIPSDFYYFTYYVYGPVQSADYDNVCWVDDMQFYSKSAFGAGSATVTNKIIDARVGTEVEEEITVVLTDDTYKDIASGTDISSWFNLPEGLKATVKARVYSGGSFMRVLISGTVTAAKNGVMEITIAGDSLVGGNAIKVAVNENTKYVSPVDDKKDDDKEDNKDGNKQDSITNDNSNNSQDNSNVNNSTGNGNSNNNNNNYNYNYSSNGSNSSSGNNNSDETEEKVYARMSTFTITGKIGAVLKNQKLRISISGDTFNELEADTDVSNWFNLPKGLTAKVSENVAAGSNQVIVLIEGALKEEFDGVLTATIPGDALTSGEAINVDDNEKSIITVTTADKNADVNAKDGIPIYVWIIIAVLAALIVAGAVLWIIKRK